MVTNAAALKAPIIYPATKNVKIHTKIWTLTVSSVLGLYRVNFTHTKRRGIFF